MPFLIRQETLIRLFDRKLTEHPSWGALSVQVIWLLVICQTFRDKTGLNINLLRIPLFPSYLVIRLFGRNFMWKSLLVAILVHVQVIELFGYLIKILCENSSSLSLPKLLGYLVEISCQDHSLVAIPVQVIGLFGYLVKVIHQHL